MHTSILTYKHSLIYEIYLFKIIIGIDILIMQPELQKIMLTKVQHQLGKVCFDNECLIQLIGNYNSLIFKN